MSRTEVCQAMQTDRIAIDNQPEPLGDNPMSTQWNVVAKSVEKGSGEWPVFFQSATLELPEGTYLLSVWHPPVSFSFK